MLDFSPSSAEVDPLSTDVIDGVFLPALRRALKSLATEFYVPGSQLLFRPDVFVTVMAWTPFLTASTRV